MAADAFAALLGTARYPVGAKIAAVRAIRNECQVSDSTAYEALKLLEIDRRLTVQHGMRSVVLEPPASTPPAQAPDVAAEVRSAYAALGQALERLEAAEVIERQGSEQS
jgi:DNA-binding FadR family transcriptional regulator